MNKSNFTNISRILHHQKVQSIYLYVNMPKIIKLYIKFQHRRKRRRNNLERSYSEDFPFSQLSTAGVF